MDTFLVHVWRPAAPLDSAAGRSLRGTARHIGSGRETRFNGVAELAAFLTAGIGDPVGAPAGLDPSAEPDAGGRGI